MNTIPSPLLPGDKIGIVAPAGNLNGTHQFESCCSIISKMGFELVTRSDKWPGTGFLSDGDDARLDEFHDTWKSPDIKAIFALRGGYGSLRIIDRIDFSIIRDNPKYFFGFSDITILLNQIFLKTGLVCMHGPVLTSLISSDEQTIKRTYDCLTGKWNSVPEHEISIIRHGKSVEGKLLGGNLCTLVTMLGTQFAPDLTGAVLFLEDINEPLYRLDRLLTQLSLSGKLEAVKGIILGDFSGDRTDEEDDTYVADKFVAQRLCELTSHTKIPIWGNFPAGHCRKNIALPIGGTAIMDNTTKKLNFRSS